MTNCSIEIRNAWHFYYALVLVSKALCCSHVDLNHIQQV
ncbi:DUF3265 domain-containing protein [Vibrio lentus]|nr:DUF3265 domain-containing protein [Vibrio lentus]